MWYYAGGELAPTKNLLKGRRGPKALLWELPWTHVQVLVSAGDCRCTLSNEVYQVDDTSW